MLEPEVESVVTDYKSAYESSTGRREAWAAFLNSFQQKYPDEEEEKFTNNVFDSVTYECVDVLRVFTCSKDPAIRTRPKTLAAMEKTDKLNQYYEWLWYVQDMDRKRKQLAFYQYLFGLGVMYGFYRTETGQRWEMTVDPKTGIKKSNLKEVTTHHHPDWMVIDVPNEFFPDPLARCPDDLRWVILKFYYPLDYLKKMVSQRDPWFLKDAVDKLSDSYEPSQVEEYRKNYDKYDDGKFQTAMRTMRMVELLYRWEPDRCVAVANRSVKIKDDNPYPSLGRIPMAFFYDIDMPTSFWGMGEGELLAKMQHELNTIRRMRIDAAKQALRLGFIAPNNSTFDPSLYYNQGQQVLTSPMPDMVRPFPQPNLEQVGFPETAEMRAMTEEATGVNSLVKGYAAAREETAMGRKLQQGNTMSRVFYKLDNHNEGLKQKMEIELELVRQFGPDEQSITMRERGTMNYVQVEFSKWDFLEEFAFEVEQSSAQPFMNDDSYLLADILHTRFMPDQRFDGDRLLEMELRLLKIPYWKELLKSKEQLMAEMEAQKQAMLEQQNAQYEDEMARKAGEKIIDKTVEPGMGPPAAGGSNAPA